MSWKKVLVGGLCVCAWVSAQAGSGATAQNAVLASNEPGPLSAPSVTRLEFGDTGLPHVASNLNERIVRIPVDTVGSITLEATIFKPDGPGPFPMVVFNHGKMPGDPHAQARSRPLAFAREFVRRGYVVVAPNREGFAGSSGTYRQEGCDVEKNGMAQADDVAATIAYMSKQSYVDAAHVVVAGTSHGGLATIAYGATATAPGVRGLINFSGGLRQDACEGWKDNLTHAFEAYGQRERLPSLWLYGDNDSIWPSDLVSRMYAAYVGHGAHARMVDFGSYKNDAHRLVVDRDGVQVWWPSVDAFLARIGMPTRMQYRVDNPPLPQATGYAAVDSINAVPYVDAAGRAAYSKFLRQFPSRAFAISPSGAWSWAEGGDDPVAVALNNCRRENHGDACSLYAVNSEVVWQDGTRTASTSNDAPGHEASSDTKDFTTGSLASR
ncbi:prolyl oligopeptidase family serine peptidase [Paraburkholderia sp. NMBU_R16]|uniref:dienelactone hydrolase family protein n=1 Tax=Paraburkholderia sp. NMBU_R16 TaxID=2698676 RepID=UPI001564CCB2|nr:prolyl oligopeptidase family serine peptidase [Paraburkholderia sp. NMBU_R16]NRO99227.1 prolyl oligopeptidase family serine peptidase [Paraburkholderia sp. NMBU_R16]